MTCKSSSEQTCNPRGIHLMIVKLFILKHLGLVSYGGIRRFLCVFRCFEGMLDVGAGIYNEYEMEISSR